MNYIWENKNVLAGEVSNWFFSGCHLDDLAIDIETDYFIDVTLQECNGKNNEWKDVLTYKPLEKKGWCGGRITDGPKFRSRERPEQAGFYRLRCNTESVITAHYRFTPYAPAKY